MHQFNDSWLGKVMTVRGLISAEEMGCTLPHEHLIVTHQGPLVDLTDPEDAVNELLIYRRFGGSTLIDMTNIGLGRRPELLKLISEKTSIHIVMATGYYKDAWLPPYVHDMSVEDLSRTMIAEILDGLPDNGIHAGVIGELGVSRPITSTEEKILAAGAKAQRETGAAINVHFDIGGDWAEYNHAVDILENEGADLSRVVLDHFISRPDEVELCKQLSSRGCYIEFDLFGQEKWTKILDLTRGTFPEVQAASLNWFISAGMLDRILISQDIANHVCLIKNGGYGYAHILKNLLPLFRDYGITDQHLNQIMVENPKNLFPLRSYQN